MPAPATPTKVYESRHDHVLATWRNFAIVIWRHETRLEAIEAARNMCDDLIRLNPDGIHWMTLVEADAVMPSQEARAQINAVMNKAGKNTLRSALVFEGTGFRAAATRSVVTGISFLNPFPFPHKIFGALGSACAWFAASTKGVEPGELARAVESARLTAPDNTSE